MKNVTLRKVVIALASVVGAAALTACATSNPVARAYYLDRGCNVYYVDDMGKKVVTGKYNKKELAPLKKEKGADGRWYRQDAWGNRVYVSRWCAHK